MPSVVESSEEMEERYTDLFKKLDKGADGRIDIKDLTSELKELGVCESYAEVVKMPDFSKLCKNSLPASFARAKNKITVKQCSKTSKQSTLRR